MTDANYRKTSTECKLHGASTRHLALATSPQIVAQQPVESPSRLCYRHRGTMKTNLKTGCKRQHPGKPALGLPRSLRRVSAPRPPALATPQSSPARLEQTIRGGPVATDFLIANPELEFSSSHRKHCPLKISNRKFSRVFHSDFSKVSKTAAENSASELLSSTVLPVCSSLATRRSAFSSRSAAAEHQALAGASLIYGSAIRTLRK